MTDTPVSSLHIGTKRIPQWCIIHLAAAHDIIATWESKPRPDEHEPPSQCSWDILAGDRPSRAVCVFVPAQVTWPTPESVPVTLVEDS